MMARHQIPFWKVPAIARYMRALMARDLGSIRLFEGIAGVLQALHARGVVLAIVSSNSRQNVQAVLGPEIAAWFSHYECGAALFGKLSKVRKVLAESRIARDHALMVGDEIRDAEVAREGGIAFGAVAWGYNDVATLVAHGVQEVYPDVAAMGCKLAQR
jgi:phosphoglycolate phosphatase